mgnify:CR=1 FL=1
MLTRLALLFALLLPGAAFAEGMPLPGPDPSQFQLMDVNAAFVVLRTAPVGARPDAPTTEAGSSTDAPSGVPDAPTDGAVDELSVEERKAIQKRLQLRRKMADVHQALSIASAGLIVAADVVGLINFQAIEEGNPPYRDLKPALAIHRILAASALTTYWGSGIIAWTMPPAYKANIASRPDLGKKKADSGDTHVALSVAHGIGMGTMMVTGLLMANAADNEAWSPLMVTHLASGLTTAALVIAGGIVIQTM